MRSKTFLSLVMIALFVSGAPLTAQARFGMPSRALDITNYRTLEECLSLLSRLRDSVVRNDSILSRIDTFSVLDPLASPEVLHRRSMPPQFVQFATTCAERFTPAHISSEDLPLFITLFLQSNRDSQASTLVSRYIETNSFNDRPDDNDYLRVRKVRQVVDLYSNANPARYDAALQLLREELKHMASADTHRIILAATAADIAEKMRDSVQQRHFTDQALDAYRRMASTSTISPSSPQSRFAFRLLGDVTRRELLDSLRNGVSSYLALRRSDQRFIDPAGTNDPSTIARVGEVANEIDGDFWFLPGRKDTVARLSRPAEGVTSLVVFLSQRCRHYGEAQAEQREYRESRDNVDCFSSYAMLKRIAQRFPNLAITLVAQTEGFMWPSGVLTPAEEAAYLRQWWLDYHKLPAALAVTTASSWHLPSPDSRRFYEPVPNSDRYRTAIREAVVVDRNRTIIERFSRMEREDEPWLIELLEVLEGRRL